MIDNPLPDQLMLEMDYEYLSEQFYEHCKNTAIEICKEFNVDESFYDLFTEWYTDLCLDSDEGYSLINDKSLIDDWWEENSDMYENPSPYQTHDYCLKCDCILRYDESDICCSCEKLYPNFYD